MDFAHPQCDANFSDGMTLHLVQERIMWTVCCNSNIGILQLIYVLPVHSLLLVKSMPTIKLDDSKPARARASVT